VYKCWCYNRCIFLCSSNAFLGAYPTYGSFININPIVDSSANPPCEWQYNGIVEGFSLYPSTGTTSGARVQISIEDYRCINAGAITGVYFYAPVGASTGVYTGTYTDCCGNTISSDYLFDPTTIPPTEKKFATNAKRMGAPYRNPIAGWRKTLKCCEKPCIALLQNPLGQTITGDVIKGTTSYSQTANGQTCSGIITDYIVDDQGTRYTSLTVELDNCCCVPVAGSSGSVVTNGASVGNYTPTNIVVISRETSGADQQPTNTVYKDNYSGKKTNDGTIGCCATDCSNVIVHRPGIQGRTHRPIIRSGMQEKRPCCIDSNGKCDKRNDYSFSYWQYQHNKRCLDYQRSQEKYVGSYPACVTGRDGKQHCQNAYRKASCCDCDCDNCTQFIGHNDTGLSYLPQTGDIAIQNAPGNPTGTVINFFVGGGQAGDIAGFTISNDDCNNLFVQDTTLPFTGAITFTGPTGGGTISSGLFTIISSSSQLGTCSNKATAKTIYKPSNKKFSHQGAVTSGGRLERLKLDTIKSANSKCTKNAPRKCITIQSKFTDINKTYTYPNGRYGAGKPRFTGWMFNGHHREVKGRVYNMVRYNQQPLGIPQLTANPAGKTCIKKCFPRTLNLGSTRSTAAGNRARVPGTKCPDGSVTPCNKCGGEETSTAPCGNIPNQTGQGLRCC